MELTNAGVAPSHRPLDINTGRCDMSTTSLHAQADFPKLIVGFGCEPHGDNERTIVPTVNPRRTTDQIVRHVRRVASTERP